MMSSVHPLQNPSPVAASGAVTVSIQGIAHCISDGVFDREPVKRSSGNAAKFNVAVLPDIVTDERLTIRIVRVAQQPIRTGSAQFVVLAAVARLLYSLKVTVSDVALAASVPVARKLELVTVGGISSTSVTVIKNVLSIDCPPSPSYELGWSGSTWFRNRRERSLFRCCHQFEQCIVGVACPAYKCICKAIPLFASTVEKIQYCLLLQVLRNRTGGKADICGGRVELKVPSEASFSVSKTLLLHHKAIGRYKSNR